MKTLRATLRPFGRLKAGLRFRSSEKPVGGNQPVLEIVWAPQSNSVYFLKDHLGSIRTTVSDEGEIVGYDDYDPWGLTLAGRSLNVSGSQEIMRNKFAGKEFDDDFGLDWYYFGARYYDPSIGRWFSPDPLASQYPSVSPYVYALNNPVTFFDPNGMEVSGDSSDVAQAAKQVNKALADKGVEGASASVKKEEREKTGLAGLFAKVANFFGGDVSTTETVFTLSLEGFENISANDPLLSAADNALATEAFNMLSDIVNSEEAFTISFTDAYNGSSLSVGYGGGINDRNGNVFVSPLGNRRAASPNYGEPALGIFFHELVGHSHPNSTNASVMNRIFNNRFGSVQRSGHPGQLSDYKNWRIKR